RFISLRGVRDVRVDDFSDWVLVELLGHMGQVMVEVKVGRAWRREWDRAIPTANAIADRIREVLQARENEPSNFDRQALSRGHRDIESWVRDLHQLRSGITTFREQGGPTEEHLLRVVEDSSAPPTERLA